MRRTGTTVGLPTGVQATVVRRRHRLAHRTSTQVTRRDQRGAEHVQADEHDRQVGEVLHEADAPCSTSTSSQRRAGRGRVGRRRRAEREQQPDGEADQQEDQVGVELAELQRVEPVARRVASPACGPEPVTTVPSVEHQPRSTANVGQASAHDRPRAHGGRRRVVEPVQEQHREPDRSPASSSRWNDTTHGLRSVSTVIPPSTAWAGMPSASTTDEPQQVAAADVRQRGHEGGHRDRDQHEGQRPVAELDRRVHVERAVRRERPVGAPRPGRAAEPGAGQPDGAAGDDQHDVGDQGGPAERAQPAVGPTRVRPCSLPRERPRGEDGADSGPDERARPGRARRRRRRSGALRIASPSAPEGSHAATCPNAPYDELGSTTAPPASSSR